MKIHEYQAKEFIEKYGIPTPKSLVAKCPSEAQMAAVQLNGTVVVKAQVHAGGRGKAGGVKLAKTPQDAFSAAEQILGMDIKGSAVKKVLVAEAVKIKQELYVSITVDRATQKIVFMVSAAGGMDIEEVAATQPDKIKKIYVEPFLGLRNYQVRQIAAALFTDPALAKASLPIFKKLYSLFIENDCSLVEINPLIVTEDNRILAIDSKILLDDNALDRHPDFEALRDLDEEDLDELEAQKSGLSFVKLDGNIGCIVNGAGLAMGTMDTIKLFGGDPANFLDVGGSSNPDKIIKAFELILKNKKVNAVLINIFGGITRCDDIASGLLKARQTMTIDIPVVIRLAGTNADKAKAILSDAGQLAYSSMEQAVKKVVEVAR